LEKVGQAPTQELIAIEKEEAERAVVPTIMGFCGVQLKNMLPPPVTIFW
jgi:hypothetical protein